MSPRIAQILAPLVLWTGAPSAAQRPASTPQYPATLKAALDYNMTSDEDVGTVNVPLCRTGAWSANLKLNLVRKQAGRTGRHRLAEREHQRSLPQPRRGHNL